MTLRLFLVVALCLAAASATAQSTASRLELNRIQQAGPACRVTFTGQSALGIDALVVETVLFDTQGGVALITLFDFGTLPPEAIRVRQFDLPDTGCDTIGRLLFNGVQTCTGAGCGSGMLEVSSRVETVEVLR